MNHIATTVLLLALGCVCAADAPVASEKLTKHLGPVVLDYLKRAEKAEAFKVGDLDEKKTGENDRIAGRIIVGEAVALTKDQLKKLVDALLADDTYFRSSSLGTTKAAVGYRIWTDHKECLEASCCLRKGNLRFTLKNAEGKIVLDRGIGGFREDKANPLRPLAAELFPDDKEIVAAVPKTP